jgi:hypothetical protein
MHTSTLISLALASLALSQETVNPISQISDGQIQGPTGLPSGPGPEVPSTDVFVSSTTTIPYENPFTSYLTMTNSLGVVTGMPSVVTSQPVSPTLPSYSGYAYGNSTTVGVVPSTMSTLASATETVASPSVPPSSSAASATIAESTGGAEVNRVAGCGVALVVMGIGFSML